MTFAEPITTLTDYAMGAAGLYFAASLFRMSSKNEKSVRLWSAGFTAAGIAALVGGTYHGFALTLDGSIIRSLWNITVLSAGISAGFMVSGFLTSSVPRNRHHVWWLKGGLLATFSGFVLQQSGIRNHNDLYHCVQIVALYLFFRGVCLMESN